MLRPTLSPLATAAVVAALLLGACSDDTAAPGPTADATTTTTGSTAPPSPPTTRAPTPEAEVEAAYVAIMARYFERLADPDARAESFEGHSGEHHDFVVQVHQQFERDHAIAAPGASGDWPIPEVLEASLAGDSASLTVCLVDDSRILDAETGEVLDDDVTSKLSVATLTEIHGSWTLANQRLVKQWSDSIGCNR